MKHIYSDYAKLLKDYIYNPNGYYGVTADNFSSRMALCIPAIAKLSETRPKDAFQVMMYASEHCYGDLDFCYKSSGFGETEEPFKKMDGSMVEIIEKRVAEEGKGELGVVGDVYESDGEG
ncbi:putative glycoside hydrolase family protein [Venturia nashicola]|uniref:Putative glycoside hydrolase family 43 protein n=1 Tax=Venturia nashicola TaxID=86259 RepID=A0A4Z1PCX1_9PEZI|nr:putative glycoside hydrolase family 43 protein [Venturia nashicola]TLD39118.1 putative glycoside hydrolase family protein [Venturia nashicola]